ncbi:uncharacterized protein MYCGRDRAFT_50818 [Zymoseptoria tritici IPO323]|uniref:Small ribosomal subunit protein mS23 n=1 Tax=Zymoseptoria tritici (strain CBS 115943 / IPO323) TaxID=336722 RepID=F9XP95_ZYMTI|nr:uncharacterized protein MYCGRDRAFT_50818 [Zymoseptoria tritici IPO323]EGP83011.1 hypothetical protein MYCGRDRAFT_50818 [Zymoseptoria tritici IPO323]
MGRYDFAAQNVHKTASQLLAAKRLQAPPPWHSIIATYPPSDRLVRTPKQRPQKPGKRASRLFQPLNVKYEEDRLRWEYFNDHPWELARPRVMLEEDGRDHEKWDWNRLLKPLPDSNLHSVVQRQQHLMKAESLPAAKAYDRARKELYRARHFREVQQRVAREEALAQGAYFGPGPLQIGMQIEDKMYENWKEWAVKEIAAAKALAGSAYTGLEQQASIIEGISDESEALQEVVESVPGSNKLPAAMGGVALHP